MGAKRLWQVSARTSRTLAVLIGVWLCLVAGPAAAQGSGWQPTSMWGGWGHAVSFSPNYATDGTIFVGMRKGGLFKSTDGGRSFTPALTHDAALEILSVEFSPAYGSDKTVFASVRGGLWRSTDAGATWTQVYSAAGAYFWHLAVSPNFATDGVVMAVASSDNSTGLGVLRSAERGASGSWRQSNTGLTNTQGVSIAIAPDDANIVFYGSVASVFRSTNGGATWAQATSTGIAGSVHDIAVSPNFRRDGHVYLGVGQWDQTTLIGAYVWKSTNGGSSFTKLPMGGPGAVRANSDYRSVALPPDYDGTDGVSDIVFAGRPSWSTFRSNDGGQNWVQLGFPDVDGSRVLPDTYDVAVAPTFRSNGSPRTIAAAVHGTGLFLSDDAGASWRVANNGLFGHWMHTVKAADDGTLFAAISGGGVMRSDDGGTSWQVRNDDSVATRLGMHSAYALATSPNFAVTKRMVMGNAFGEWEKILYSADGGLNWTPASNTGGCTLAYDAVFTSVQIAFLATQGGICRTTDGGDTWRSIALSGVKVHALVASPNVAVDGTLFAGTLGSGVYRSIDGGNTWQSSGLGGKSIWQIALSPTFATDGTLFAGAENGGIWRSTDRGASWTSQGFGGERIRGVAVSSLFATDRTVWIASSTGDVRVSTDGGATWRSTALPFSEPTRVWLTAGVVKGAAVYASTQGRGLWQLGRLAGGCQSPYDFDANGRIDVGDIGQIALRWRAAPGSPDYEVRYDVVLDNLIDIFDIEKVSKAFNQTCG